MVRGIVKDFVQPMKIVGFLVHSNFKYIHVCKKLLLKSVIIFLKQTSIQIFWYMIRQQFKIMFMHIFVISRFGKFIHRRPINGMSQLSTASTTTGTPNGPPMSQETFEYLWNTLGEVTENG